MDLNHAQGQAEAEASNHVNLGLLAEAKDEFDRAQQEYERALELDRAAERRSAIAGDLLRLARLAVLRGFPDRGAVYAERAYRGYLAQDDMKQAEAALRQAVECAARSGRKDEVARLESEWAGRANPRPVP